jgi:DNA-binding FrmR family transcriptional regulator
LEKAGTAAARRALGELMAELIDGHIRHRATQRERTTDELIEIVRSHVRSKEMTHAASKTVHR